MALHNSTRTTDNTMEKYSLWLSPAPELAQQIKMDITRIAATTGGPVFDPHVTLAGDVSLDRNQMTTLADGFVDLVPTTQSTIVGSGFGNTYFQSFFLKIEFPSLLHNLRQSILKQLEIDVVYPPHISLAYGASRHQIGEQEVRNIEQTYCSAEVEFASVDIVASSEDTPVEKWAYVNRVPLVA